MSDLVAVGVRFGTLAVSGLPLVPALVADLGEAAAWRYIEFLTANIRNPNTRRAYARACSRFFRWCEERGLPLVRVRPFDMAAYVEMLQRDVSASSVKQQLAAIRMLCDWLVTGQVMPSNPASSVRGPKHVVKVGKTPVLGGRRVAAADGGDPHPARAGSARPGADRGADVFLCADRGGAAHACRGRAATGGGLGGAAAGEGRAAARDAGAPRAGRRGARLRGGGGDRRGPQRLAVPLGQGQAGGRAVGARCGRRTRGG